MEEKQLTQSDAQNRVEQIHAFEQELVELASDAS